MNLNCIWKIWLCCCLLPATAISQNRAGTGNSEKQSGQHRKESISFNRAEGGLLYKIVIDKPFHKIKVGDFISLNITTKTDDGSFLSNTCQNQYVSQIMSRPAFKGDIAAGLTLLCEGDSAVFKANIDSIYKRDQRPADLSGQYLTYMVRIQKVIVRGDLNEDAFTIKWKSYQQIINDSRRESEPIQIEKYLHIKKAVFTMTPSGLSYVITNDGIGPKAVAGDTVSIFYKAKFLNGTVFETNIKSEAQSARLQINPLNPYNPLKFVVGASGIIDGLTEVIKLLSEGSKASIVVPSKLAYGENGYNLIQPYSPLSFDIEVVKITPPKPVENGGFKYSFLEKFEDNKNAWPIQINAGDQQFAISKQKYFLSSRQFGLFESVILTNINSDNDYRITAIMNHRFGNANSGYGIVFSYIDKGNFYFFEIAPDGNYRVCRYLSGQFYTILPWTLSDKINTANDQDNTLRVWYQGGQYCEFYINGVLVNHIDNFQKEGGYSGFIIRNKEMVVASSLTIEEKE